MVKIASNGLKSKGKAANCTVTARKKARKPRKPATATGADGRVVQAGRVVDSIDLMHRAGHIDSRQRQAAWTYRDAYDAVGGGIPSQLDTSRTRVGGGAAGCAPGQTQLLAAETLRQARGLLGRVDHELVAWVCCEGLGVGEAAARLHGSAGGSASARQVSETGARLRLALRQLADMWCPMGASRIVATRFSGEVAGDGLRPDGAVVGGVYEVERGRVIHVSDGNIWENKKKNKVS